MKKSLIVVGATVFAVATTSSVALAAGGEGKGAPKAMEKNQPAGSEAKLAQNIREELARDNTLSTQAKNVKVTSSDGHIMVSGTVPTETEKSKIEAVARSLAGADRVVADISVE